MAVSPVAFITGASRGIGRAVARGLAEDGFKLALLARSEGKLKDLQQELRKEFSCESLIFPLDIGDTKHVMDAVVSTIREFGRMDLLLNNAGMGLVGTLRVTMSDFMKLQTVNVTGPFAVLKAVVPQMLEQGSGMILNVASRAGKTGFADYGAYGATKFALVGLSESLYRELSPHGIKVTALCPSWVDTDLARQVGTPLESKEMIQNSDLVATIRWLRQLSSAACVKEVIIECRQDLA